MHQTESVLGLMYILPLSCRCRAPSSVLIPCGQNLINIFIYIYLVYIVYNTTLYIYNDAIYIVMQVVIFRKKMYKILIHFPPSPAAVAATKTTTITTTTTAATNTTTII